MIVLPVLFLYFLLAFIFNIIQIFFAFCIFPCHSNKRVKKPTTSLFLILTLFLFLLEDSIHNFLLLLLIFNPLPKHLSQMHLLDLQISLINFPLKIINSFLMSLLLILNDVLKIYIFIHLLDFLLHFGDKFVHQFRQVKYQFLMRFVILQKLVEIYFKFIGPAVHKSKSILH